MRVREEHGGTKALQGEVRPTGQKERGAEAAHQQDVTVQTGKRLRLFVGVKGCV